MEATKMEYTDLTRIHWGEYDKDKGIYVPLEHTTFKGKALERLAAFDTLLQRVKNGENGYIKFHRWYDNPYNGDEVCSLGRDALGTSHGYHRTIRHIENWVVLVTPVGGLELYSKRTGKLLFVLGFDPCPEWVEGRR